MNSWRLNGMAGHLARQSIVKGLNIPFSDLYKTVKTISSDGVIQTKDGKEYKLELIELKK